MNAPLILEAPFYITEALDKFVRPAIPGLSGNEISSSAFDDPAVCEALNQALRFSIERLE
jgi:hypothetical protein